MAQAQTLQKQSSMSGCVESSIQEAIDEMALEQQQGNASAQAEMRANGGAISSDPSVSLLSEFEHGQTQETPATKILNEHEVVETDGQWWNPYSDASQSALSVDEEWRKATEKDGDEQPSPEEQFAEKVSADPSLLDIISSWF